jgi:peptidoglycan-associated lipoprotein
MLTARIGAVGVYVPRNLGGFMSRFLVAAVLLMLSASACKKKPKDPEVAVNERPTAIAPAPDVPKTIEEARDVLGRNFRRVYFDFDSAALSGDTQSALAENAAILQSFPQLQVEVQGHADERGTTDYNIALGERRAEAVKKYLLTSGAAAGQLRVVSFGEERPAESGEGEVYWSKNRRAEFRVLDNGGKPVRGTVN